MRKKWKINMKIINKKYYIKHYNNNQHIHKQS